ncbi:MAG: acetyl-CoA carboxylase biotin carboxylase subunit [Rhodospirillaceae bacterium]|nr:acetyl-CoA carboxylase biotin carboxylase subunit [Rhodospirillaceae bacterium]
MRTFKTILVANRGEIACRVMRSAREMGYRTVAVYSDADASAPHVRMADDAVRIGPAPVSESYLDMNRILAAAKQSNAEAVHPGYGFLSENAEFARACADAGLTFIGPSAEAIDLMGNKAAAKRRMIEAGVPCVPGYEDADQSDEALLAAARVIGFPLMVKAAAGGGGRGMRLVDAASALPDALTAARSEALNAFGSDELILEKAILRPRHVEMQVFADAHGNTIHLGERDCSVQRRHQKVVEEAPCPVMTEELRQQMGNAAVDAARSIDYRGAGTVEFLLGTDGTFYFLEMNTRLQVEHPVTEMITGLDLVALQIQVSEGHPLGLEQSDISLTGHAIEVRLYAEDTAQDFLPCTGDVELWRPAAGAGLRFDSGIETGQAVSPFYDPMIAKAISWGETREIARHRLIEGLRDTVLFGLTTNRGFLIDALSKDTFAAGEATTAFIGEEFSVDDLAEPQPNLEHAAMAAVIQYQTERSEAQTRAIIASTELLDWSSGGNLLSRYVYASTEQEFDVTVSPEDAATYRITQGDETLIVEMLHLQGDTARLRIDGRRRDVHMYIPGPGRIQLALDGQAFSFRNRIAFAADAEEAAGGGRVLAPMHGTLLDVLVAPGDTVNVGTRLAVLEAMKMQHDILSEIDGTVVAVNAKPDAQAAAGDMLIEIEPTDQEA